MKVEGNAASGAPDAKVTKVKHGDLVRAGNHIFKDDRYEYTFKKGELIIRDTRTKTSTRVWGDPHVWTGDGDKLGFHKNNLTLEMKNGTKLRLVPTEPDANGVARLDQVAIMAPKKAFVIGGISDGGPKLEDVGDPYDVDALYEPGTILQAGDEVDDFYLDAARELVGDDGAGGDRLLDGLGGTSSIAFQKQSLQERMLGKIGDIQSEIDDLKEQFLNGMFRDPKTGELREATETEKQYLLMEIQDKTQQKQMLWEMLTNLSRSQHESNMSIARNLRV